MNLLASPLAAWYGIHARDLPWRRAEATPWSILLSEIMLQQTPAARVVPYWQAWMSTWPTPRDLAQATTAEVIQAWGTLGYPRRALRLRECARVMADQYDDVVPSHESILRRLPGIGEYTAAAVAAFAFKQRTVVLDTNIRRVLSRASAGEALPLPHLTAAERSMAASLVPEQIPESVVWNQSTMELGAVICKAREAACESCPVKHLCTWRKAGFPGDIHAGLRRTQPWHGTNRQARGQVMAILREADGEPVPLAAILATTPDSTRILNALDGLVTDGLAVRDGEAVRLP
ncbi:MAG: A/G-specific adenine glycosylase [Propionibacteriaceae bacterium]|nr:A/G-specific adenine glycosylase [Propionibacteriaceae bacterium]